MEIHTTTHQTETSSPQIKEVIINEQPITISVIPHTFHTNTVGETRSADVIMLKNTTGQEVMYRVTGSPMTHTFTHTTPEDELEHKTLVKLQTSTQKKDHLVQLIGDEQKESRSSSYTETTVPGFLLRDTIRTIAADTSIDHTTKRAIATHLLSSAIAALSELNMHDLIHNHPTPANFLVTDNGEVFLIDYTRTKPVNPESYYDSDVRSDLRLFTTFAHAVFDDIDVSLGLQLGKLDEIMMDENMDYATQVATLQKYFEKLSQQDVLPTEPSLPVNRVGEIMMRQALTELGIVTTKPEELHPLQKAITEITHQAQLQAQRLSN